MCLPDSKEGINIRNLAPHLREQGLLTVSEYETIIALTTVAEKITHLLCVLCSKGPHAYYLLAYCLEQEKEHCTHWELF